MLVEVVADFIMHGSHAKSRSQSDGMKSTSMRNLSRSCWHVMLWATWGLTTQPQQVRATVEMTLCLNALSQRRGRGTSSNGLLSERGVISTQLAIVQALPASKPFVWMKTQSNRRRSSFPRPSHLRCHPPPSPQSNSPAMSLNER